MGESESFKILEKYFNFAIFLAIFAIFLAIFAKYLEFKPFLEVPTNFKLV